MPNRGSRSEYFIPIVFDKLSIYAVFEQSVYFAKVIYCTDGIELKLEQVSDSGRKFITKQDSKREHMVCESGSISVMLLYIQIGLMIF